MSPRVAPGTRKQLGPLNAFIVKTLQRGARTQDPPRLFATLGRHRRLFRPWLRFAGRLMPGGKLPRRDAELVILRVSALTGSDYERVHHERIGARVGLTPDDIAAALNRAPTPANWSERDHAILWAVDDLHEQRTIGDDAWQALRAAGLSDTELIELPLLVGHYEMLAMFLNALHVEPDRFTGPVRGRRR